MSGRAIFPSKSESTRPSLRPHALPPELFFLPQSVKLANLFPDEDYRFAMRFERGRPEDFFAPTDAGPRLLAERERWLDEEPAHYAAMLPGGEPLLEETFELLGTWPTTGKVDRPGGASVLASLTDG